ncbi:MAG: hypothetical protein ACYTG5_10220 [Planctomycetota bacterium]
MTYDILRGEVIFFEGLLAPAGITDEKRVFLPAGDWTLRTMVGGKEDYREEFTIASGQELRLGPG